MIKVFRRPITFSFALLAFTGIPFVSEISFAQEVQYQLDFPQAKNHYVQVTATFQTGEKKEIQVFLPVWTPGSYLVREYARHIEEIVGTDEKGKPLTTRKLSKNRWEIRCEGQKIIRVSYRLYCREMSVRTNWVEESFAILNGAPTFLTTADSRQSRHVVKINLPSNWKKVSTALLPVPDQSDTFSAPSFDFLVDSPILLGNQHVSPFKEGGATHELVNLHGDGLWDFEKATADVKKIVAEHQKIWGVIPYKDYKFLNLIVESGGGLEHDNSTLLMTSRWSYGQRARYLSWLGLVSHEFFHTWNIRRLRPKELVDYDYEQENYFTTLWIAEGVTSYYDDLVVKRANLSSEREYLAQLSKSIRSLQTTEGRLTQSLSDSSYDTWIKFYRPDENSPNSQISYYTKGAIAAFLLDAEIRNATDGKASLDDLLKALYENHSGNRGYTSEQFRQLASKIAGKDLSQWFATAIDSTDELDYTTALKTFGLEFRKQSSKGNQPVWLGVKLSNSSGIVKVSGVVRNSPGFNAGLNVDDEIISIDGFRVTSSDVAGLLKPIKSGDVKECLIVRRGRIEKKQIKFTSKPSSSWSLSRVSKPTDQQTKNYNSWLGIRTKKSIKIDTSNK